MVNDGQAIIHFLTNHYEKEIAKYLYPFWYHYYSYISDYYTDIDSYVINSHGWMEQVNTLSQSFKERFFFYSKLPVLNEGQKKEFFTNIQKRLAEDVAIGVCLPHTLSNQQKVLGFWENTYGDHMRLHIRNQDIHFGFIIVDDQLLFERPTQPEDNKRHIYHVKHLKEETTAYLLKNPHLKIPKLTQNYFLT